MANPIRVNRTHFNDLVNDNAKLSGAAFTGDVSVTGNLDVTGTTTSVINLDITDSLIGLNNGLVASNTNDSGILIGRGQDTNAFMGWDESAGKFIVGATAATASSTGNLTITTGTLVANLEGNVTGDLTGNAATATKLASAVNIGGVSFDGSVDINLPGVNGSGNQNTTGSAATLTTARNIGGVSFDGSVDINLPGVNGSGNQNTSGNAHTATKLASAVNIGGVSFDGSADINLPGVNSTGDQNTTGSAAKLTTARNIGGVSFDGSVDINLPGVNGSGNQNTSGNAHTATSALTVTEAVQAAITSVGTLTGLTMADEGNIVVNATTGTKIGTATSQKLGFFNATPVVQQSNIADASSSQGVANGSVANSGSGTLDVPTKAEFDGLRTDVQNLTTKMNAILTALEALGLLANA